MIETTSISKSLIYTMDSEDTKELNFRDLTSEEVLLLQEGKLNRSVVLQVGEGESIPFNTHFTSDLVSVSIQNPIIITAQQTFYVRCNSDMEIEFSLDKAEWKSLGDFVTGNLSVGVFSHDNEAIEGTFSLAANIRKV